VSLWTKFRTFLPHVTHRICQDSHRSHFYSAAAFGQKEVPVALLRAFLVAFVLIVGVSVVDEPVLTLASNMDWCEEEPTCGPSVSCDAPCWVGGQGPPFETTCGGYGGWFPSIYGACLGECGDGVCNPYNDEDYDSCSDDCGWCGDGICQAAHEAGGSNFCAQDCGSNDPLYNECNPGTATGCEDGEFCNANEECVVVSTCNQAAGVCRVNGDCCVNQNEYCFVDCEAFPWMCSPGNNTGVCLPGVPSAPKR
jgi:hypothetical protein